MNHLVKDIITWAAERGIFAYSTVEAQYEKLQEEMEELKRGIDKRDRTEIKDGIGDCIVVLTLISHMFGYSPEQCLAHAWSEIKDRKGKMVDGKFVKEEKLDLSQTLWQCVSCGKPNQITSAVCTSCKTKRIGKEASS